MARDRIRYLRRLCLSIESRPRYHSELEWQQDQYALAMAKEELRALRADDFNEVETDGASTD